MSSITNPKVYAFPKDTRHAAHKALFGTGNEMEMYYSGGMAYFKSSGLGEFYARGSKVLKLVDGGIDVIGKLYVNGMELAITPGSGGSVAWADIIGAPPTYAPSPHDHDDRYYTESEFNAWFELTGIAPNQYIRCKFPLAGDYEIQAWSDTGWLPPSIWDSIPVATSSSVGGVQLGTGSTLFLREDGTWQSVAVSPMVYPTGSGIPLVVSGTSWGTTITDNSANWNTAYGWGNHASAGYLTTQTSHADVVVDGDFASQGIMLRGASSGVYSILTNNSTNWNAAYGWGDHAGLYRPITYVPAHNDTTSIQGGTAGEYYHLSSNLYGAFEYVPNSGDPYLRVKLPIACDYEIQAYSDFSQFPPTIWESMPVATTTSVGGIQYPGGTTTYLRADGTWVTVSSGGVTDHGALTGLGDDDHTQYYNQTRGDARYSLSGHTHAESTITFTDITTGNATTSLHGYLPKLGGGTTNFLRADGTWAAPAGGSGLTQQQIEGLI